MRSSSGKHFVALDHVRAVAAFVVIAWHFLHSNDGRPVPFEGAPLVFPLALADEGHTGVALFMVLSGYLFAKLLNGKQFSYPAFLWNRFLRLTPLLLLVFVLVGIERLYFRGESARDYLVVLVQGLVLPTWPNGGWSITSEMHFYIALPILIFAARRSPALLVGVLTAAILLRLGLFTRWGEVQTTAYWTIIGRVDQFTLGVLAFLWSRRIGTSSKVVASVLIAFSAFWWWFDWSGGFYGRPIYPSPSALWIVLPTIEGIAYGTAIAWYDSRGPIREGVVSTLLQRLGEYSYSIYLLHFFLVFRAASYVDRHIMDISNVYVCLAWAAAFFVSMLIPGYLSFRIVESPFLRFRRPYVLE